MTHRLRRCLWSGGVSRLSRNNRPGVLRRLIAAVAAFGLIVQALAPAYAAGITAIATARLSPASVSPP